MYEKAISRTDPGCIVFLLDRSDSMKRQWGSSQESLAEGAARALNEILLEICFRAQKEPGTARHYFDIGIFGYGMCPGAGGEGVESAFGGVLTGRSIVGLPELYNTPIAVRAVRSPVPGTPPSRAPVWVEPVYGGRTPMCQAMAVAGRHVFDWATAHPNSFPPIIINMTDGMVTDSPHEGATLDQWAQRLTSIQTRDGAALLFNVFLSPAAGDGGLFLTTARGLPPPGPALFGISSPMPPHALANAREAGISVKAGARAFCFNADSKMLVSFLEIGTRVTVRD